MSEIKIYPIKRMPDHLQELIDQKQQEFVEYLSKYCNSDGILMRRFGFEKGAEAMYQLIIHELGPLVEAIKNLQCYCHFNCDCGYDEAKKALKHLKERILK